MLQTEAESARLSATLTGLISMAVPWFLAFNASIGIHPVMVPGDLAKANSAIEAAVTKYR